MPAHMGASAMKIYAAFVNIIPVIAFVVSAASSSSTNSIDDMSTAVLIRVDQSGKGDFKKIQDAIDSVPSNNSELFFIWVKPGTYREKIVVPADKPFITVSGTQPSNTIITSSDGGEIYETATFTVLATDFVARFLTIQQIERRSMAAALRLTKILSWMTLEIIITATVTSKEPLISYSEMLLPSSKNVHVHTLSKGKGYPAQITAQGRQSPSETTGFTFLGCKITGNGIAVLGRPWGAYSKVVYAFTYMSSVVVPAGWDDWGDNSKHSTVFYGEFKNYGPGADRSKRVLWSHSLSNDEAAVFLTKDVIGGKDWLRPAPKNFKRGSTTIAVNSDGN
ncbi:hypothetical protein LWI28_025512 [Acer negundo]|uniref:pectinesterase n=1 Tax=Acer negundo TaxID=4023 RepID=A0AAD5NV00_ACENE|nr:hypothetical protein LWI28_025512 [Acer negundo]